MTAPSQRTQAPQGPSGSVEIIIPGRPVAKGRPRFGNGRAYTPDSTRAKEREIAQLAKIAMIGKKPFLGPVAVAVKAWVKGQRTGRPDLDNICKSYCDALNGIVYSDDSQIVDLHIQKFTGSDPQVIVTVEAA